MAQPPLGQGEIPMSSNINHIYEQLTARVERELAEDQDLIMEKVMKYEIADSLQDMFGVRLEVSITSTKKFFGTRFVKAFTYIGVTNIVITARRSANGYTVISKVVANGTRVSNARELQEAHEAELNEALNDYA